MNEVIEVVRNEDGEVSVSKVGIDKFVWLGFVLEEGLELVDKSELEKKFDEYLDIENENVWYNDDVKWDDIKKEYMKLVDEIEDDKNVFVCMYGVEVDFNLVLIVCDMDGGGGE